MRALTVVLLAAGLAACAQYQAPGGPVPAPAEASQPPPAGETFATELAGPETFLPPLPTAVVVLRPDDMERNRAFCRAVLSLPTARQVEAASVVAPNLIRTRWLVQIADIPPARATDCDFLTGTYDYARAAGLVASITPQAGNFAGRGPFLLMIIPDRTGLHVAGLDGSLTPNEDMAGFVGGWGRALAESQRRIAITPRAQPGVVRSVFQLVGAVLRAVTGGAAAVVEGVVN